MIFFLRSSLCVAVNKHCYLSRRPYTWSGHVRSRLPAGTGLPFIIGIRFIAHHPPVLSFLHSHADDDRSVARGPRTASGRTSRVYNDWRSIRCRTLLVFCVFKLLLSINTTTVVWSVFVF